MESLRVFVRVVGFSDVERHALNTIFRLSQDRSPTYAPWLEGQPGMTPAPSVVLVDGSSAEAVLSHVREVPPGQRLIWVGPHAPVHAWRVLPRPIQWAALLMDLDALFAAQQADSGYLDLDISTPVPLDDGAGNGCHGRALLVGPDGLDQHTLTDHLLACGFDAVDRATGTDEALKQMARHEYAVAVLDLDAPLVDAWALAQLLEREHPRVSVMGMSEHAGPLTVWWRRRRLKRHVEQSPMQGLLARPVNASELRAWLAARNRSDAGR